MDAPVDASQAVSLTNPPPPVPVPVPIRAVGDGETAAARLAENGLSGGRNDQRPPPPSPNGRHDSRPCHDCGNDLRSAYHRNVCAKIGAA